jgi:hypothetical protein
MVQMPTRAPTKTLGRKISERQMERGLYHRARALEGDTMSVMTVFILVLERSRTTFRA